MMGANRQAVATASERIRFFLPAFRGSPHPFARMTMFHWVGLVQDFHACAAEDFPELFAQLRELVDSVAGECALCEGKGLALLKSVSEARSPDLYRGYVDACADFRQKHPEITRDLEREVTSALECAAHGGRLIDLIRRIPAP